MKRPVVSVIITTKNEAGVLGDLLQSLACQTYKKIEVIIVDNHSTDRTIEIAKRFGVVILTAGPERSAQRNFGARQAKGSYVLFLDADMVLAPTIVSECVQLALRDTRVKLVVIPERSRGSGFWAACKALERRCYEGDESLEAARFFQKDAFWQTGGYDELLTGPEDWDLPQKMKRSYAFKRISSYIIHNERTATLASLAKKKFYYGLKVSAYITQHPLSVTGTQLVYLLRPAFYRNWRLLAADPVHTLGMIVMLSVEQAAGFAGFVKGRFL